MDLFLCIALTLLVVIWLLDRPDKSPPSGVFHVTSPLHLPAFPHGAVELWHTGIAPGMSSALRLMKSHKLLIRLLFMLSSTKFWVCKLRLASTGSGRLILTPPSLDWTLRVFLRLRCTGNVRPRFPRVYHVRYNTRKP